MAIKYICANCGAKYYDPTRLDTDVDLKCMLCGKKIKKKDIEVTKK
jgi:DNA-directed RNA polymerase subunit RPC12/RpoP